MQVRARLARYVEAGVTHFIFQTPPPLDMVTLRRLREEVLPGLQSTVAD